MYVLHTDLINHASQGHDQGHFKVKYRKMLKNTKIIIFNSTVE